MPKPNDKRPKIETEGWDPFDYESVFEEEPVVTVADRIRNRQAVLKKWGIRIGIVVVAIVVLLYSTQQVKPLGAQGDTIEVSIPAGASTSEVGSLLAQRDVVPNAFAFRVWAKITGGVEFQAGKYNFRQNSSDAQAVAVLEKGPKAAVESITIPEGFRVAQVAQRVGQIPGMSADRFMDVVRSGKVRSNYQPQNIKSLEGFLFPDTYAIGPDDDEESLLRRMVNEFDDQARRIGLDDSETAVGHSPYETLVIASMIEAEAKTPGDRSKISTVIENRLFKNMKLQVDATVLYALGNEKQSLSSSDLKVDSPYNTYQHTGLPPAPIDNPGLASIDAALHPATGEWLYYVVIDKDGNHAFANTYEEHQQNVALARERGLLK